MAGSPSSVEHRLQDVPLFAGLAPDVLAALARESRVRRYQAGQVLWSEGDPGETLLVLEEGQLRVSRFTPFGQEVVLAVIEPPAALGELALLDGAPRDASVIAQRAVVVRLIARSTFQALLRREPALAEGLLTTLAGLVRSGNARHVAMIGLDVPGRLAAWLLERTGGDLGKGRDGVAVPLGRSQGELAAELGTTRATLNRALKGFETLGFLAVEGDRVVVLDSTALTSYTTQAPGFD